MAGYLLHHDDGGLISVLYCELHPQSGDRARLSVYENERCQVPLADLYIGVRTTCCEKVGVSCSCFFVEDHLFSARTLSERKLWLRAISNVKVKLQHRAPIPTPVELSAYRSSIQEHLASSREGRDALQRQAPVDALLGRREFGDAPRQALRLQPAEQPQERPPPAYAGCAGRPPPGYAGCGGSAPAPPPQRDGDEWLPPVADELSGPPAEVAAASACPRGDASGDWAATAASGPAPAAAFLGLPPPAAQPEEPPAAATASVQEATPPCAAEEAQAAARAG
ncbi:unnamed protein product [Prorocentrum cordatum]|uniref:PH domain-containing protein n=1 Tax=Prorocentrum cordatum TaxID=2364126 RepID=A0ABN9Q4H1_9DINO|nr:unnamed protein product [Polarella glacialis]